MTSREGTLILSVSILLKEVRWVCKQGHLELVDLKTADCPEPFTHLHQTPFRQTPWQSNKTTHWLLPIQNILNRRFGCRGELFVVIPWIARLTCQLYHSHHQQKDNPIKKRHHQHSRTCRTTRQIMRRGTYWLTRTSLIASHPSIVILPTQLVMVQNTIFLVCTVLFKMQQTQLEPFTGRCLSFTSVLLQIPSWSRGG